MVLEITSTHAPHWQLLICVLVESNRSCMKNSHVVVHFNSLQRRRLNTPGPPHVPMPAAKRVSPLDHVGDEQSALSSMPVKGEHDFQQESNCSLKSAFQSEL